ncbi:cyclic nucleotide-binding domain-containing protein, partial [Vallitalea sediminicola]
MLINILQHCSLFKNMKTEDIESILSSIDYDVINYSKEQIISIEGEECNKIGIVLEGNIEVRKIYPLGKSITVTRLN